MSCERMESRILAYVDGRLNESEHAEVQKHLDGCAACRVRANEFSSVSDLHLLERGCVFNSRVQFHLHVQTLHSAEPSPILDSCTVAAVASRIHTRNAPDQLTYKLSQRVKATYYEMLCELL